MTGESGTKMASWRFPLDMLEALRQAAIKHKTTQTAILHELLGDQGSVESAAKKAAAR